MPPSRPASRGPTGPTTSMHRSTRRAITAPTGASTRGPGPGRRSSSCRCTGVWSQPVSARSRRSRWASDGSAQPSGERVPLIVGLGDLLGRFAGRLLNSSLGWATILLFGKVSGRKQAVLLGIALGAVVWVLLLIGVALPDVGTALLAFVPAPSFVSRDLIRLAMLVGAVALPLVIGIAAVYVTDESHRPTGAGLGIALLRGYPFTFLLALTIAFLAVIAVVRKVQG